MNRFRTLPLLLTLITAVMLMTVLGGCGAKKIAEVPDPEYFFEGTYIDEINEHDDVKQIILRSNDELWTHAAAYVNLLKYSGKYEFVSFDEDLYPSGDYMWNFEYNGTEEVKDAYYAQIEINYYKNTNGRDNYAVWITIHDLDNFELVENDVYDPANIYGTEPVSQETKATSSSGHDDSGGSQSSGSSSNSFNSGSSDNDSSDSSNDSWENNNNDLYDAEPICGVCDVDGDCDTCGGDGLLHSSASDKEDRNCYSCSGSGNCRSCGGDGKL